MSRRLDDDDNDGGKDDDGGLGQLLKGTDTSTNTETSTKTNGNEVKDNNQQEILKNLITRKSKANVPKLSLNDWENTDIKERILSGSLKFHVESITPRAGPTTGGTRVTVRGPQIENVVDAFPKPKCRFGKVGQEVDATYIACTKAPLNFY